MPARERRSREPTHRHGRRHPKQAAGVVLLDLVVALALFVIGGLAVLTQMESGARRIIDAEHRIGAHGVARTALALLESGSMGDRELNGPAGEWASPLTEGDPFAASAEWYCEVDLEPSEWDGLSLATVRVRRVPAGAEPDSRPVIATLRQLVPTGPGGGSASALDGGGP